MSVKINCLNPIAKCGMELLPDTYEVTDNFADADAVLVRSASMHDLELSDNLLAVARAGAGVNNIPLDKCAEKGIVVFNTPGANANGVKELVVAKHSSWLQETSLAVTTGSRTMPLRQISPRWWRSRRRTTQAMRSLARSSV